MSTAAGADEQPGTGGGRSALLLRLVMLLSAGTGARARDR